MKIGKNKNGKNGNKDKFNLNQLFRFDTDVDYEVIVATEPESYYAESYRKIPLDIKFSSIDKEPKVIQITSALAGEHKTTTVINLAAVYVEMGKKVIAIDCDLRKPRIHYAFDLLNEDGLTSFLIDKVDKSKLIQKTSYNIDVITSGPQVPLPHVVLSSEKFKNLVHDLREEYDIILIDCPPVLLVTDSIIISEVADTTLFVLNQSKSKKSEVKESIRTLRNSNVNIAGIIVSGINKKSQEYKYRYGYKYKYKSYRE